MASIGMTHVKAQIEQPGSGEIVEVLVRCDNRDMVRYDLMRERRGWPHGHEAPLLWLTVQLWSALAREQHPLAGDTPETFLDRCVLINRVNADGSEINLDDPHAAVESVNPTRPGHVSGS